MCTSFAVYKNKPIYAMNFDCWPVDSRFRIGEHEGVAAFYYETDLGGGFLETAAMNSHGFFGNFQGNLSEKHKNIAPGAGCKFIGDIYRDSMDSAFTIADFYTALDGKTVLYPPVPPEQNKLHNMFADMKGGALILETADGGNDITEIKGDFLVMTNFPAGQFAGVDYRDIYGAGSERYQTAYEYIDTHSVIENDDAFKILKDTMQKEENWETLVSMVFVPEELCVYIAVKRGFDKIWRADIRQRSIESYRGFESYIGMEIAEEGINLTQLEDF